MLNSIHTPSNDWSAYCEQEEREHLRELCRAQWRPEREQQPEPDISFIVNQTQESKS